MNIAAFFSHAATPRQIESRRAIAIWLLVVAAMVVAMVTVGGLTRLTGSGLSITQWKPIHGALPPLSDAEWQEEFDAYKQIPQYERVNKGMTVEEFKSIFWWEWGHRNLGRLIGFAFLIPFLVFLFRGQVERALIPRLLTLFILGGMQGVLGWFMVMSGLTERVEVSQYRLAAHFGLAIAIYVALVWTALPLLRRQWPAAFAPHRYFNAALGIVALIYFQMLLGAFVAGLNAGLVYNTWPLMDGALIPAGLFGHTPWWLSPFEDVTTVQFNHRMIAYVVTAAILALLVLERHAGQTRAVRVTGIALVHALALQVILGIWTLLAVAPIWLSALHQLGAVVLLTAAVVHAFVLREAGPSPR